jgi:hypothetical protein
VLTHVRVGPPQVKLQAGRPHKLCAWRPPTIDSPLEAVVQTKLYLPRRRAHAGYLTEVAVRYSIVRISVAGNVEDVKEIGTEAEYMLFAPYMEVLEQGRIDLTITGGTLGAVVRGTKGKRQCHAVSTGSIGGAVGGVQRRWISSPPVVDGTIPDDHLAIVVRAAKAKRVEGIAVVRAEDGDGNARIQDRRGRKFPSTQDSVNESFCVAAVRSTVPKGKLVDSHKIQAVADIHPGWTPVGSQIVTILDGRSVHGGIGHGIVAR